MPWRVRSIFQKCQACGKAAMCEVFDVLDSSCGFFCDTCGRQEVERRNFGELPKIDKAGELPDKEPL